MHWQYHQHIAAKGLDIAASPHGLRCLTDKTCMQPQEKRPAASLFGQRGVVAFQARQDARSGRWQKAPHAAVQQR